MWTLPLFSGWESFIHFNKFVTGVEYSKHGVKVHTENGTYTGNMHKMRFTNYKHETCSAREYYLYLHIVDFTKTD